MKRSYEVCPSCGKKLYSAKAEARHRHNFPMLCDPPKLKTKEEIEAEKEAECT